MTRAQDFGKQLQKFRQQSHDIERPGKLSRRRFGVELAKVMGLRYGVTDDMIYNLEAGRSRYLYQDRELIKGILKVLIRFGAITRLEEANLLLDLGGNHPLDQAELEAINVTWIVVQPPPLHPTTLPNPKVHYETGGYVSGYFEEPRSEYEAGGSEEDPKTD